MELKSHVVRTDLDSNAPLRGLALVKHRKPELSQRPAPSSAQIFSSAEMRHNFAIWALQTEAASGQQPHLYYCLRCKWTFRVDDRWTVVTVTPLDADGSPIHTSEATERLATFGLGPCPVFSRLRASPRLTQEVARLETFRGRLAALISAGCRAWKVRVWRCREAKVTSSIRTGAA